MLVFLRRQLAIQALGCGSGHGACGGRFEERRGALLHVDRDAKQILGVADTVVDAGENDCMLDRMRIEHRLHVDVVATGQRVHVLPLHRGEAGEELAQRRVGGARHRTVVEGLTAELDLECLAHRVHRRRIADRARIEQFELAAAQRTSPVGKREAFADLGAGPAVPA
jgi:hypothetical protein